MSRNIASFVLAALSSWMIIGTTFTNAQPTIPGYGKDSVQCVTNLALYREYYKQKDYRKALTPWRYVFSNCPHATENIFINGAYMYNCFIAAEKDSVVKQRLIDSLLLIYDTRIINWGNEGKQLANKANDLLTADSARCFQAFGFLKRSILLLKTNSEESTLINYCRAAIASFKLGKISNAAMIDLFNQTESIIDANISQKAGDKEDQEWRQFKRLLDMNILPLLQCSDISSIFIPKITAKPDDPALLKRITDILFHRGCTDDSLYLSSLEKMNTLAPNPNTAFMISREYLKRKNVTQAVAILTSVAEKLNDNTSKAQCYYYLGVVYADVKDFSNARTNALKALQLKADFGDACLLIADCYAQSALDCGKDNVGMRAAFWCAVDKLNEAKKVEPKLDAKANLLIQQYSQKFPNRQMLLSAKLKVGSKYLVGCWINETTVIRLNTGIKK